MERHFEKLVKSMEYQLNEQNKYMTDEQNAYKGYLICRLGLCIDEWTRIEILEELGVEGKKAMSSLEETEVELVSEHLKGETAQKEEN